MFPLQKRLIRLGMAVLLKVSAMLAVRSELQRLSFAWSHLLAALTMRHRHIAPAADLADLGRAWQRGFPNPRQVPIETVTPDTVYARIETPCPLRGSGRTAACWRMMEYDRAVAAAAGGQFIVLQSQAEPGVSVCRVALRPLAADTTDLVPAHRRAPER